MRNIFILLFVLTVFVLPAAAQQVGSVEGTVITADDDPVGGAIVILRPNGHHGGGNQMQRTVTDDAGSFEFERVIAGEYEISAMVRGAGMAQDEIEVIADEVTEVVLVIDVHGGGGGDEGFGGVTGTVSDPDGEPIAAAEVIIMHGMGGGMENPRGNCGRFITRTNDDGAFAFDEIPAGEWTLVVGKRGYLPFEEEIEVVEEEVLEIDVVLELFNEEDVEFGSVSGSVNDAEGEPIELAHVMLIPEAGDENDPGHRGEHNGRHGWGRPLVAFTDEEGLFSFDEVPVGDYIARAAKRGYIHADEEISVNVDEDTEVNFELEEGENDGGGPGGHRGGRGGHNGEDVELNGWAIVVEGDRGDIYLLDEDDDGEGDYLLNFGPPDYEPDNGAERPVDGDEIEIVGKAVGHMEPPMVIVLEINGEVWRELDEDGHGGRPGGGGGWGGDHGEIELIEADGFAIVNEDARWMNRFMLDTDEDGEADYRLCFGDEDYDPGNGVERPEDGDFVDIVGGEFTPRHGLPVIIVYEIDGNFWREPGDTLDMFLNEDLEGVTETPSTLPIKQLLVETYPNPFNPSATISIDLNESGNVRVALFDMAGREIYAISSGYMAAGQHRFTLNGDHLNTGTYLLRVETPNGMTARKVLLVK